MLDSRMQLQLNEDLTDFFIWSKDYHDEYHYGCILGKPSHASQCMRHFHILYDTDNSDEVLIDHIRTDIGLRVCCKVHPGKVYRRVYTSLYPCMDEKKIDGGRLQFFKGQVCS